MYKLFILFAILVGAVATAPAPAPKPTSPPHAWPHSLGLAATGNSAPRSLRGGNTINQVKTMMPSF
jgi:hypothetical protein